MDGANGLGSMGMRALRSRLPAAELAYAKFNADRTATEQDSPATLGTTDSFVFIRDPNRPTNAYYNRAWCSTERACTKLELSMLPSSTIAVELVPDALSDSSSFVLTQLGFHPSYSLCYLGHSLQQIDETSPMVDRFDASRVDAFLDLLEIEGAAFPPERRNEKRGFYCTDTFQCFGVRDESGRFVGWSTVHIAGDIAFFGNTFVIPKFRRLGYQRLLLTARLRHARECGALLAFTDVEPQSQSQANCERVGFRMVSTNTIWVRQHS
jgi:GNAT superfamily N-acetyltransferase